ncbi:MAG: methyltransferase [Bacillota bacterium]
MKLARDYDEMINTKTSEDLPAYYNQINTDLLACIPATAGVVLEIGCGAGAMGQRFKGSHPDCRYLGVEFNPQAAAIASQRLDSVVAANAETVNLAERQIAPESIDCLVYGDVLEHFAEPLSTLRDHLRYLKIGGSVVACIPNIQHLSVIVGLLQGKWDYTAEGLLDTTHLRFFTRDSIQKLFANAGLQVEEIKARNNITAGMQPFQELLRPATEALGINFEQFAVQTAAFQYLVIAEKAAPTRPLLIQSLLGETAVCSRVRISEPDSLLATIPGVRIDECTGMPDLSLARAGEGKIFIWQRLWPNGVTQQQQLLNKGYLIIGEMDDDPGRWQAQFERDNYLAFRSCHALQVSTEPLAAFMRKINPNVAVFANQIAALPPLAAKPQGYKVNIFFGALNREADWQEIMPEINRLLADYGKKINFFVIHDRMFFDALCTPYKQFIPLCPFEKYQQQLLAADIALLPLQPTRFNSMKSDLKFLECAASGVVAVASPIVYEQTVRPGATGFIYRTPAEFGNQLRQLIDDQSLREAIRKNAWQWVKSNRLLAQHYRQRYDWYTAMLDKLPQLNIELRERAPELLLR